MQLKKPHRDKIEKIFFKEREKIEKKVKRYYFDHRFIFTNAAVSYEDLMQEAYLKAWEVLCKFKSKTTKHLRGIVGLSVARILKNCRRSASNHINLLGNQEPDLINYIDKKTGVIKTVVRTKKKINKNGEIEKKPIKYKYAKRVDVKSIDNEKLFFDFCDSTVEDMEFYFPFLTKIEREIVVDRLINQLTHREIAKKNGYTHQRAIKLYKEAEEKILKILDEESKL